ncbi:MAG: hypothetical protein HOJ77_07570, partial [Flavobacteriales bacterium]|nr:hypothetical protein [Flavobacteriales bacterium]
MAAIFFRCFATLVLALLVVVAAQNVQANDPTTEGLSNSTRLLFKAINENDPETARTAVSQGANVGAENSLGVRPVDLAVDLGHFEVAHFLLAINQAPVQKQEEIPLPPPVALPAAPLPPLTPPNQIAPPVLSGPQFSAPVFKPVPPPAISPPVLSPPVISAPQMPSQPRIAAPRIAPPQIQAPALPTAPEPSAPTLRAPSIQAIPAPPKFSPVPPPAAAPVASTAIKAPPEPPPLTNDDGTLVQTPKAMPAPSPSSAVTATTKATKGIATTPAVPKSGSGGFMSNVWNSMTGWVPFTGDKNAPKDTPAKQVQTDRPTQVTPAPIPKKISKPASKPVKEAPAKIAKENPVKPAKETPAKTVKEAPAKVEKEAPVKSAQGTPKKPGKGFFSSAWDSMTGWVPFTGDKKETKNKVSPTNKRLPFSSGSSERSSKALAAQDFAAHQSTTPDEPARNINDEVEAPARAFAKAREQKDAEQKVLREKAAAAAKLRAEAELAPPAKSKPKTEPVFNQEQAAAEFKQKVQLRRQVAAQQENQTRQNPESIRQTSEPTQTTEALSQIKESKKKSKIVQKAKTTENIKSSNDSVVLPNAKKTIFDKIRGFFKSVKEQDSEEEPETETTEVNSAEKDKAPVTPALENKLPED